MLVAPTGAGCGARTGLEDGSDGGRDGLGDGCVRSCDGRVCGDDGCGGTCAPGCAEAETCTPSGRCITPRPGTWVRIDPGTFWMGAPPDDGGLGGFERPDEWSETRHQVTLTRAFMILSTEVTQGEFEAVMGYCPSYFEGCGPSCPADSVTWHEALAYCNALSEAEGLPSCFECEGTGGRVSCALSPAWPTPYDCPGYRLPTDAEWEYAARGSVDAMTYNGDPVRGHSQPGDPVFCPVPALEPIAWHWCNNEVSYPGPADDCSWYLGPEACGPQPVGLLRPNAWGLFDAIGNVGEYCLDGYVWPGDLGTSPVVDPFVPRVSDPDFVVVRPSSYMYSTRVTARSNDFTNVRNCTQGFRPARTARD